MKKINIPLLGITRNTDDGISTDGECMELINARVKNGSISPIGRPILIKQNIDIHPVYMHEEVTSDFSINHWRSQNGCCFQLYRIGR